jgi:putative Mg2+ transporter-C (MgtC) family protein
MRLSDFIANSFIAVLLGALIGLERQWRQRNAGLRTNALVALGASLFVSLSQLATGVGDVTRIAAQVVSGIGFLGAGLMMREGLSIRGLNTAATLWCAGAVGTLAGLGFLVESAIGAALVIVTHLMLRALAIRLHWPSLKTKDDNALFILNIICRSSDEQHIRARLVHEVVGEAVHLQSIESEDIAGTDKVSVTAFVLGKGGQEARMERIVGLLSLEPTVSAANWKSELQHLEE